MFCGSWLRTLRLSDLLPSPLEKKRDWNWRENGNQVHAHAHAHARTHTHAHIHSRTHKVIQTHALPLTSFVAFTHSMMNTYKVTKVSSKSNLRHIIQSWITLSLLFQAKTRNDECGLKLWTWSFRMWQKLWMNTKVKNCCEGRKSFALFSIVCEGMQAERHAHTHMKNVRVCACYCERESERGRNRKCVFVSEL